MQDHIVISDFMPHGHCYFWEPYILWSHAISDSIIALAYMTIPFSLFYIYNKRRDFTYRGVVILFAIFIFGCGVTHIFDVINIWHPIYRIDSLARIITALASIGTAIVLIKFTPRIVALPTLKQWEDVHKELSASNEELSAANEELNAANEELQAANEELTLINEQLAAAKDEIQKLSDKALQQSQKQYQDLAESISDIFFAVDSSFRFTYWNKTSEKYSGMKSEQVLGKNIYELYPHLKDTALDRFYQQVLQSGKPDKFIQTLEERYGNTIHEVNAYPSAEGIAVITVDITARQQAKKQLEEQKNQLELALWGADLGMWDRDLTNDMLHCDERYMQITGLKPEESANSFQDWAERVHPEDATAVIEKLRMHEEGDISSYQQQYRMLNSSGEYIWVMSSAKVVERDAAGKPLRIVGVLQDISEIKQAEETNRFFRYLIDHTHDPIYWIDPHNGFRFTYVNKAACKHYGFPEEKLLTMSITDWDPTFTLEKCHTHWERVKKLRSLNFESVHRNAQGEEIPVEISTNYLKYGDREYFGGHFKNISERKKKEEQEKALKNELIRQNEQLQQFGFITSHNLRSPVASLLGLVEVFDEKEFTNKIHVQAVHHIRETAGKMDEILKDLNQILEYQKSINEQREWVKLEDIIFSVQVLLASSIQTSSVQIITEFDVRKLYTVKSYLQSIFYNLISNAIKYKDPGRTPKVYIRSSLKNEIVHIAFSDNGLGIDLEKNRERIFGLYKRFHYHVEGRGMGLHLVKTQIEALHGKVKVDSKVGEGTTFTISLPYVQQEETIEE
ncbi:PAS domain S-box protein [Catalinimonas niigatensis]|uniref:PAS domain S-box protein n=1 Tax=Catalinimonas niigatensis TaxID=1397264 RepID=UPI002666ACD7|nr:PAS domain S-box protein [Catalinimonas niigatensis]WPP50405.1 PAS domain S-box protein [Catalinimonas niigatensis]